MVLLGLSLVKYGFKKLNGNSVDKISPAQVPTADRAHCAFSFREK
jgi:hypothetical protein